MNRREKDPAGTTVAPVRDTLAEQQSAEYAQIVRDRIDQLRGSVAFQNYEQVRDHVLRMKDLEAQRSGKALEPSAYWREELENFEYMLDAHPLIIDKLRHHSYHITGLRVYDYRSNKDAARALFAQKLEKLVDLGGRDLLIPEPPDMGGFGFEIEGLLYNIDTLKFYEVLIAMQRGGVLSELREPGDRKLVWEIGAGWGGFPCQLKTVCPKRHLRDHGLPRAIPVFGHLLEDAVSGGSSRVLRSWLARRSAVAVARHRLPVRFELVPRRVCARATRPRGQHGLLSGDDLRAGPGPMSRRPTICRARTSTASIVTARRTIGNCPSLSEIIAERFWPHEISVLPVSYPKMLNKIPKGKGTQGSPQEEGGQARRRLQASSRLAPHEFER